MRLALTVAAALAALACPAQAQDGGLVVTGRAGGPPPERILSRR